MKRKTISLVLTLALCLSCAGPVSSFAAVHNFVDVVNTEYESAVGALTDAGVIDGYSDGSFKPEGSITRAEVSKILGVIIQGAWGGSTTDVKSDSIMTAQAETSFKDLGGSGWAKPYIGIASSLNIVNGYGDGSFVPTGNITYNELAAMAVRACNYDVSGLEISWPENYQTAAEALNLFKGTVGVDLSKDGNSYASRGNVAIVVNNALSYITTAASKGYPATASAGENVMNLSLEEAIEIMKTKGMQAETAAANKASDQATLKVLKDNISSIKSAEDSVSQMEGMVAAMDPSATGYSELVSAIWSASASLPSKTSTDLLKKQRDFIEANINPNYEADMNSIEESTRKLYYAIDMLQQNVANGETNLKLQQTQLDIVKAKYSLGMASSLQVSSQESALASAKSTLATNKQSLLATQMQFCMAMNLPLDTELVLTTPLEQAETEGLLDVETAIDTMLSENLSVKYLDFSVESLEKNVTSMKYTTSTTSGSYKQAASQLASLKLQANQAKISMEQSMRTSYAELDQLTADIDSMKTTVDMAQTAYDLAQTQFSLGMNTKYDVDSAAYNLSQAKLGYTNAVISYNNAVDALRFQAGVGTSRITFSV